jgi:hypothetical protein
MLDTGRNPRMGFEPQQPRSTFESVNDFAERMALGIEEAKAALTKAKDKYAMYYNRRREPAPVFALGDKVWLDGSNIATNRPSSKLSHQRLGPFCKGTSVHLLTLPPLLSPILLPSQPLLHSVHIYTSSPRVDDLYIQ